MSFKPEGWDQIHQSFKDPDGQYVGVAVYALSYAYNTQAIAGIDVPRSVQDFLKPEFKGKVITCYPNDDGRPTPERGQTLHHLVSGEGTAKPNRHLVDALGCPSTIRSQTDIRVSTCQ
jgi:ABC-type Fe3+ transport system substrate-binding protein